MTPPDELEDDEPDLHELGGTPLRELGVPDPAVVDEDEWLEWHK